MIRHVVTWKLATEDPATKLEHGSRIAELLGGLPPLIPEIRSLSVGVNVAYPEDNWDVVLIANYDSLEALEAYQAHPEHVKVAAVVRGLVSARAAVDFEL